MRKESSNADQSIEVADQMNRLNKRAGNWSSEMEKSSSCIYFPVLLQSCKVVLLLIEVL